MVRDWNGVSLLYNEEWEDAPLIELFTDACNTGYGAYLRISMPFLEMRALLMAASTWGHLWQGKKITFRCDCQPVVQAFEKMRSRTVTQMHQIRSLHQIAVKHHFDFRVWHIVGETNVVADELSRHGASQVFRELRPNARHRAYKLRVPPLPTVADI